jgi:glycine betaine/proline transport system ATP-binding protein
MAKGEVKLACKQVWKLFGEHPQQFMAQHNGAPSREAIKAAGYVSAACDVNLDILEGEIFVIMGLSGSGKSTLVRCLSRLIEPTGGQILFEGLDLLKATKKEMIEIRRHKLGMVFQHFALLPHLNVLDNVAFPLEVQGVPYKERQQRAQEVVDLVGLKGKETYYPSELSGGQQQRVGIARSLAIEPDLWFLDEPFSALDPLIRREMQDEFLRLQGMLNKTIVFITHDFDEAIRLADRIAIMKDGEVVQVGTPEELVTHPANDYVTKFIQNVPRAKVLSVRAIMEQPAGDYDGWVAHDSKVFEIAELLHSSPKPFSVKDESGRIIGQITRDAVLATLFEKEVA